MVGTRSVTETVARQTIMNEFFPWEQKRHGGPKGHEVLTMHLEKLADADSLVRHWNHAASDGSY